MVLLQYTALNLIIGALLNFFGRYVFWLFVAIVSFIFAIYLSDYLRLYSPEFYEVIGEKLYWALNSNDDMMRTIDNRPVSNPYEVIDLMIAVFTVTGFALTVIFRKYALVIAGFLAGGAVSYIGFNLFFDDPSSYIVIGLIGGSAIGGVLGIIFSELALVYLTSTLGALLLFAPFYSGSGLENIGILGTILAGISFQNFLTKKLAKPCKNKG